jgi:serine/threonine-protein kinase
MGEVYLANDSRLKRNIALKILPPYFTKDQQRLLRFQQEARAASALNHPNIITIFDIGEVNSIHYIATELIDGETLRWQIEQRTMHLNELMDVGVQVASALAAAHEEGIVHRDIKPENIMVRRDGYVKVLDFGLAKPRRGVVGSSDTETTVMGVKTEPGVVFGTVKYMSPEQARGLEMDPRTDIFSLGVVIYELASGAVPFDGDTPSDVIAAILGKDPVPLETNGEKPEELNRIVLKALSKNPDDRYQNAHELLNDLKSLMRNTDSAVTAAPSRTRYEPRSPRLLIAVAFLILVAAGLGMYWLFRGRDVLPAPPLVKSIAVLPLKPIVAESRDEALEIGMADSLIFRLGSIHEIVVRPTSAIRKYSALEQDPLAAGREQQVDAVLEGSIHKSGEKVRVTVRLVRVADGQQLWADTFDEKLTDLFTLQDSISDRVAEILALRLINEKKEKLTKRYTENAEAYQLYLKGRHQLNRLTDDGFMKGRDYFQRAIDTDSKYALAYAGLATSYTQLAGWGVFSPGECFPKATAAATKALELDDQLVEAHISLGTVRFFYEWNWAAAEHEFKRAIQINASEPDARQMHSYYLSAMQRFDEALLEMRRAHELDPVSLVKVAGIGEVLYFKGEYDRAAGQYREALELDPNSGFAHWALGNVYLQKGMYQQAISEYQTSIPLSGDSPDELASLGYAYALSGKSGEAQKVIAELTARSKRRYVPPTLFAFVYTGLGEKDRAFEWLDRAFDERDSVLVLLNAEPMFGPLRSDPRFVQLARRIGLMH